MSNREEQPIDSGSSDDENGIGENSSSEPVCPICLGKIKEKAFVNACLHQFCFGCLWDWIKVKLECPLCKQNIVSVFHNVRADDDYSEIRVERTQGRALLNPERNYLRNAEIRLQDQHEVQHGPVLLGMPGNERHPLPANEGQRGQEAMEQLVQEDGGQLDQDGEGEALPEEEQQDEEQEQMLPPQEEERSGSQPQARADILSFQVRLRSTSQHLEILPHLCQLPACRTEHGPVQNHQSSQSNVQMHQERHPQCTCHSHHAAHNALHTHHSVHRTHDPTHTHHPTHQVHRTHHPTPHAHHTHHPTLQERHIHHSMFHAQHTETQQSSHVPGVPTETQPRSRGQQTFTSLLNLPPPTPTTHSHQYDHPRVPLQSQPRPHRSQLALSFPPVNRPTAPPSSSHAQFNQQLSRQTSHPNDQHAQAHLQTQSLSPQRSDNAAQTPPPPLIRLSDTVQSQFQPPPLLRLPESMSPPSHPPPLLRMDESHSPTLHSELPPSQHSQSSPPALIPLLDAIQTPSSWQQSQYIQQPPAQNQGQQRYTLPAHNLSMAHSSHSESQHGIHESEPLNLTRPSQNTLLQYAIQTALNSVAIPRESPHQIYSQGIGSSRVPDTDDCVVVKHVKTRRRKIRGILSFDADAEWAQANEGRFPPMNSNAYLSTPSTSRSVPNYNQAPPPREYHWRGPLKRRGEYDSSESDTD
ncbi:E3 ubiquitin-protein ligase Topors [Gryllus bimaculatus]|nr:E3 ubiquitin-protein ligase Topors [Gryllus bimaculatus]